MGCAGSKGTDVKEDTKPTAASPAADEEAAATKIAAMQRGKQARAEVEAKKAAGVLPGQAKESEPTSEEPAAEEPAAEEPAADDEDDDEPVE